MIIRDYDELVPLVNKFGLLPLFTGIIPKFSLWDYTRKNRWFTGKEESDPWEWRERAASEGEVAYGKFFGGKAGFVSLRLLPELINYRRSGKSFEQLYLEHKFPPESDLIMKQFLHSGDEYISADLKRLTGITKQFDQRITQLQHRLFLVTCGFCRKKSKSGERYGWPAAILTPTESFFRYEITRSRNRPEESFEILRKKCAENFPKVSETVWKKFLK